MVLATLNNVLLGMISIGDGGGVTSNVNDFQGFAVVKLLFELVAI